MSVSIHSLQRFRHVVIASSRIRREPGSGFTTLMEAAASGHEIIVQYLLDHVSGLGLYASEAGG